VLSCDFVYVCVSTISGEHLVNTFRIRSSRTPYPSFRTKKNLQRILRKLPLDNFLHSAKISKSICVHQTIFMASLRSRRGPDIIFLPCGFFLFLLFSLPNLSGRRLDVYHTSTHGVALVRI